MDHIHTFLTTHGHGGPPRMSDQPYAGATSETAQTWKTIHTTHTLSHSNKANMEWWLRRPNDIRGPWGSKVSWHLFYRWEKTPKKPHPGNLSRPGIEPGPAAWQARKLPLAPSGGLQSFCLYIIWLVGLQWFQIFFSTFLASVCLGKWISEMGHLRGGFRYPNMIGWSSEWWQTEEIHNLVRDTWRKATGSYRTYYP